MNLLDKVGRDREVAQIKVLNDLGWDIHRIWTMDWWDNRDKEIARLLEILEKKKANCGSSVPDCAGKMRQEIGDKELKTIEMKEDEVERAIVDEHMISAEEVSEVNPQESIDENSSMQMNFFNPISVTENQMIADFKSEKTVIIAPKKQPTNDYECIEYVSSEVQVIPMSTTDYVEKDALKLIIEHIQTIIDVEAPIAESRLIRRTLRSFNIARASTQTIEVTEKAIKKVNCKSIKRNGVKFYWKQDQNPETYNLYRIDTNLEDKRSLDEICQQELKNVVCKTLYDNGSMSKEELIRETIRTMGYGRSGVALAEAVERGIKFGRKTDEIILDENKKFTLGSN